MQIASNPAHNRLDFEPNPTITLHEINEKPKKSCKKCKNTNFFKINKCHNWLTIEGGFWCTKRCYDVWFQKKLETAAYFVKWRKPFMLLGFVCPDVCLYVCVFVILLDIFFEGFSLRFLSFLIQFLSYTIDWLLLPRHFWWIQIWRSEVKGQGHSNRIGQIIKINFSQKLRIYIFSNFGKW